MVPPADAVVTALGVLVGFLLALAGVGGGAIAVPLLIFATGQPIQQVAPAALVAVAASAAIGTTWAWREGLVRYRAAALIGLTRLLAAPVGVTLSRHLPQAPLLLAFAARWLRTVRAPQALRACNGLCLVLPG